MVFPGVLGHGYHHLREAGQPACPEQPRGAPPAPEPPPGQCHQLHIALEAWQTRQAVGQGLVQYLLRVDVMALSATSASREVCQPVAASSTAPVLQGSCPGTLCHLLPCHLGLQEAPEHLLQKTPSAPQHAPRTRAS